MQVQKLNPCSIKMLPSKDRHIRSIWYCLMGEASCEFKKSDKISSFGVK